MICCPGRLTSTMNLFESEGTYFFRSDYLDYTVKPDR
jgi:hypothetical protein